MSDPQPPPQPQGTVTGSGVSSTCGGLFEINARTGPAGKPVGACFFAGPVTCLNVQGNVALPTVAPTTLSSTVAMRITDHGATGGRVEAIFGDGALSRSSPMLTCDSAATSLCLAPALPRSQEQCMNGGWRNFGSAFKSQGQCVAFVQRRPQQP